VTLGLLDGLGEALVGVAEGEAVVGVADTSAAPSEADGDADGAAEPQAAKTMDSPSPATTSPPALARDPRYPMLTPLLIRC
jgi:hypothetical protein